MTSVFLAFALVVGHPGANGADPAALIAELGASRFAQREAAESALNQLGRSALPALRAAGTHPDPEIRTRATALLRRIEAALLVEPTTIRLDFADVPIVDALRAVNQQAGLKLTLTPENPATWSDRRISVRTGAPLPFWQAIDALCEAGQLHYVFGGQSDFDVGDATFPLYEGFASHQGVFDDRGPFRTQLASLQYQSEVHLSADRSGSGQPGKVGKSSPDLGSVRTARSKQFFVQMLVGAEPRLSVTPDGPIRLLEATDDQDGNLAIPPRGEVTHHDSGYLGVNPSPLVHLRLDLSYPDRPAARLKKLKGLIPLIVSTRKPDPLEIPLAGAAHQTFSGGKVVIAVGEVRINQPEQGATIELVIKAGDRSLLDPTDPEGGAIRAVLSPQQLEVLDATGKMIPWFPSSSFYNGEEARLTLTLLDRSAAPLVPTMIRYHDLIRDRTEVPFEFHDLPLP